MTGNDAMVVTLVQSLVLDFQDGDESSAAPYLERISTFVTGQLQAMPLHSGLAVRILTAFADYRQCLKFGKPFHSLPPSKRKQILAAWRRAGYGPMRDLLRFYEILILFAWHTREEPCDVS